MSSTQTRELIDHDLVAEFRVGLRDFIDNQASLARTRQAVEAGAGFDAEVWRRACQELQVTAVSLPEELGGAGLPVHFQGVVFQEFGRSLVPSPLLATTGLATTLIRAVGTTEQQERLLAALTSGAQTAAVAWVGESGSWNPDHTPGTVSADGRVTGTFSFVLDGSTADLLLAVVRSDSGLAAVAVDPRAAGVQTRPLEVLDPTRPLAHLVLDGVECEVLGTYDSAAGIREAIRHATLMLCYESSGGARRAMEMAVEYAKVRHQFNRPIGSFQAIKHRCADMLGQVESMDAIVEDAGGAEEDAELLTHIAKAYVAPAYFSVAAENIQIHGGIGFTWEHDAHLFYRRAKSSDLLFGDAARHRTAIVELEGWI